MQSPGGDSYRRHHRRGMRKEKAPLDRHGQRGLNGAGMGGPLPGVNVQECPETVKAAGEARGWGGRGLRELPGIRWCW